MKWIPEEIVVGIDGFKITAHTEVETYTIERIDAWNLYVGTNKEGDTLGTSVSEFVVKRLIEENYNLLMRTKPSKRPYSNK